MIYILYMVFTIVYYPIAVYKYSIGKFTFHVEFHVDFYLKNRYRTHRFAIRAKSVVRVKFNVEFTRQAVSFSIRYCYDYMCFDKYQLDQDLHR